MKNTKHFITAALSFIFTNAAMAQDWTVGGNNLGGAGADRLFGISGPNTKNLVFINGNVAGVPTERGRITNTGLWGIGTTTPGARFHINSSAGQNPLTVQLNSATKLAVNSLGGITLGTPTGLPLAPLNNYVFVPERIGIGTSGPAVKLHIVNGTDAEPGGGGFIVAGQTSEENVAIDNNEIMARSNGAASVLHLNYDAGDINLSNGALFVNDFNNHIGIGTESPVTDLHVLHGTSSGASFGLRIENEGTNNENWTLYTQNSDGTLQLYENGTLRGSFSDVSGAYSALSDARFKKDIEKAPTLLDKLMQLDVKKYHFLKSNPDDKKHYGMLAQEVEKIFPEVVTHSTQDDGSGVYTMDYSSFGVLAIKGLQEMQQTIALLKQQVETLTEKNEQLEGRLQSMENTSSVSGKPNADAVNTGVYRLEQNTPNPANGTTSIRYSVPGTVNAAIIVYNSSGTPVKTIKANASGNAVINAGELPAGTYTYALSVNAKTVASKKLIVVK